MNKKIETKLKQLPSTPGVYFHKNKKGEIIYVGKAANLKNRVRQYFQKSRLRDPKTDALVAEITDLEWRDVETELDALFLEAELIRRYMPPYNIMLRDDKSLIYVRIDIKSQYPTVTFTRRPLDDGAEYLGPYFSKWSVAQALKYLRRAFPYSTHTPTNIPKRACLQAQLGLCPGLEAGLTPLSEYRTNLKRLMSYLRGKRKTLVAELEKDMKAAARNADFEAAAKLRDKLRALKNLDRQIIFGDREAIDISKDHGLVGLGKLLNIDPPRRIEGFDISHMQGTDNVASMVVFVSGLPDKSQYRKFKMRTPGNDDFAHMREVMARRFSETNVKKWGMPDLILIDGGKGQTSSAIGILIDLGIKVPLIGLAKRFEEIIIPSNNLNAKNLQKDKNNTQINRDKNDQNIGLIAKDLQYDSIELGINSDEVKLLQRIRDESHRFAVSYHSTLKRKRQTASSIETLAGIGPTTRKKLIRAFGSLRAVNEASETEIANVVGASRARIITQSR